MGGGVGGPVGGTLRSAFVLVGSEMTRYDSEGGGLGFVEFGYVMRTKSVKPCIEGSWRDVIVTESGPKNRVDGCQPLHTDSTSQ